ncbi:AMP-binding protein, partial [Nocardiopsis dassonvillei]|uniref:AMP-binding protein n=1 Tax=Nocardiopsis dassonvillei TaxID=2014 RepID=UPI00200F494F
GVLKAGAGYVPLDPAYPGERLSFMVADTGIRVVLAEEELVGRVAEAGEVSVVVLDDPAVGAELAGLADDDPGVVVDPGDRAYVIYTSGSTGRPKGVEVSHRSVVGFVRSMRDNPGVAAEDTVLAATTFSFDPSIVELFIPLVVGGRLVMADQEQVRDPHALAGLIAERGVTLAQATPSTWRMMVESGWTPGPGLRVLTGGERLKDDLARRLCAGGARVYDLYGPTETTVWATTTEVGGGRDGAYTVTDNQSVRVLGETGA